MSRTSDGLRWLEHLGDSADGLFVVDHRQHIVQWNRGAERLLGHRRGEVLNRPCGEVLVARGCDGQDVCGPNCAVRRSVARGELPKGMDVQVQTRDGRQVWLHTSLIVVGAQPGPLTVHVLHDVSHEKRIAELVGQLAAKRQENGGSSDSDPAAHAPANGASATPARPSPTITAREREVLRLLAQGLSNKAIADQLAVTPNTVRNHVQNLMGKSGSHSRAALATLAVLAGLL